MHLYKNLAIAIVFSVFHLSQVIAASLLSYPKGCEVTGFGFSKNFLIINEQGGQTFYLIQNRSNQEIELEHYETKTETFMSPKLENKLSPNRWAAFASDEENTYFQCFTIAKGTRSIIDCSEVLDVCQYPRVKFALSNMGNYWVSTNKEQQQVIKEATHKGIFLHW